MARRPEEMPGDPAGSTTPVKQVPRVEDALVAGWVREYDDTAAARSIDRLAADVDLITSLALAGFAGSDYEYFAQEITKYGLAVLSGWMRRGIIIQRAKERGFGGLPPTPIGAFDDRDTVAELAGETVAKALFHFRNDVLLRRRWDSTRGASIRTYFIGQCLLRFANIYRDWWRREVRRELLVPHDEAVVLSDEHVDGPEGQAVARVHILRGLSAATSDQVRLALLLSATDMTQKEIAERLGVSENAVQKMITHHREQMRRRGIT